MDFDDLAGADGEPHHTDRVTSDADDHSGRPVDEGWSHDRTRYSPRLAGDGRRTATHRRRVGAPGAKVRSQHDIGIEQRDERIEVTAARSAKKPSTTSR